MELLAVMSINNKINAAFINRTNEPYNRSRHLIDCNFSTLGWAAPFYPDNSVPEHVLKATLKGLNEHGSSYMLPEGDFKLREAISSRLKRYNHIDIDPLKEILVTPGSNAGLYYAVKPFITPGNNDEVLIPDPSYAGNFVIVRLNGGIPVSVPLHACDGFQLDTEEFAKRVTEKTKVIILSYPNNPTTTVYSRESILALCRLCVEKDLIMVVDHSFEDVIFDNRELLTIASVEGMWERTVTIFSLSKGFGLSGYRIGYMVACQELMSIYHSFAVNILGPVNTAASYGAIAALNDYSFVESYKKIFEKRREIAFRIIGEIPGVSCLFPESGYMLWVNISRLGTSDEIVKYLIEDANVIVNPGTEYGSNGEGYIRIIYGVFKDDYKIYAVLERVKESLKKLSLQKGIK